MKWFRTRTPEILPLSPKLEPPKTKECTKCRGIYGERAPGKTVEDNWGNIKYDWYCSACAPPWDRRSISVYETQYWKTETYLCDEKGQRLTK